MRPPIRAFAFALLLLCACGELDNDPFRQGDLVGRVLRADKSAGRVVLMGADYQETGLAEDGSFHFDSIPSGDHQLLIVASGAEALQLPVTVAGAQVTDLQDVDPRPAAFVVVNLTTQGVIDECWVKVHQTDLEEVHAPSGTARFLVGPLGAAPDREGCYDVSMEHKGTAFWTQTNVCLQPGEQRAFDVTW